MNIGKDIGKIIGITASEVLCKNQLAMINSIQKMVITPELTRLQKDLFANNFSATNNFVLNISKTWNKSLAINNILKRSIPAQNIAYLRLIPDYKCYTIPYGGKKVVNGLSKSAAENLIQTDEIMFDPKDRKFYHKNTPNQKVSADEITVAESSLGLFSEISFSDLIAFESFLFDNPLLAVKHPVGEKIFNIIKSWNSFIDFDKNTYFHARKIENDKAPYLDHEMLKAPINVSGHGRYNDIGISCYYFAESMNGALSEIRKHSGNTKSAIQIVEIRPNKNIKLLDLSVNGFNNTFIEHLRYTVDNKNGKRIKEYLLPNFVASCCKMIGIEGIKYLSGNYNCYVTWKDDYFDFVNREIIE